MIGKTISHYRILEELGRGGMGVVYKAEDTKLKRTVALKFLPPEMTRDKDAKERFIQEAQAASALQHNNVSTIHEIDESDDGQMFICMDYYEGKILKDKIQHGPLKLEEAIDTAIQIAEGLARAHEENIIHRDIKPANIIVTKRDVVKIVDFGLAKLAEGVKLTKTGTTLGTAAYMSPEQTSGKKVDRRSDIWSLGVVLYEMITGKLPFMGEYEQAVSYAIVNEDLEPVTALRTGVPMELERIVNKALAKKPDERYQHVDEMLVDLKNLRKEFEGSVATRTAKVAETHPRLSLKKLIIPVGAIFILVLAFFMLRSFLMEEVMGSAPVPIAVVSFENKTGDETFDYLKEVIPNLLITSLEQSKYLQVTTWQRLKDLLKQLGKEEVDLIDENLGFELCRMDGISAIALGSYTKAGDMFVTDVKVLDVNSKRILKSVSSRGRGSDSILEKQIDEISREVSRGIGLSNSKIERTHRPIIDVTTISIEAYQAFIEGRNAFDKYYWEDARTSFVKAVTIDPKFAEAYLYLAWTYEWLADDQSRLSAYEKAMQYAENATEKERLYIEGAYASWVEGNSEKNIRILERMAKEYPQEKRVFRDLGYYYENRGLYDKAIDTYQKALELDPSFGDVLNDLAYLYLDIGDFRKAMLYFKRYGASFPMSANPFDSMGELFLKMGKLDSAIAKYKRALEIRPDFGSDLAISYIYAIKENYNESLSWLDRFINMAPSVGRKTWGLSCRAFMYGWLGNYGKARNDIENMLNIANMLKSNPVKAMAELSFADLCYKREALELSRTHLNNWFRLIEEDESSDRALYKSLYNFHMGLIELKQGYVDSVEFRLNEMRYMLPEILALYKNQMKYNLNLLRAELFLKEEDFNEAVALMESTEPLPMPRITSMAFLRYNMPHSRDVLARAYHANGESDKAIAEYERITRFDPNSEDRLLIHPKYYYRLAKLYEEKGLKDKAIERYEKFLDFWKDADDDLPEPHDARARLARLRK